MTKHELSNLKNLHQDRALSYSEVDELIDALRSVQKSFDLLINDDRFSQIDEAIIKSHFHGTVCV